MFFNIYFIRQGEQLCFVRVPLDASLDGGSGGVLGVVSRILKDGGEITGIIGSEADE